MTQKFSRQGKLCAISWFKCRINVPPKNSTQATHTHTHTDSKLVIYASNIIKMASTPALRMRNFYLKSDEHNERFRTDRGDHNLSA